MNKQCQLHIKQLVFENPDDIENVDIQWKYDKEEKVMYLRVKKVDCNHKGGFTNISEALRDYGEWY